MRSKNLFFLFFPFLFFGFCSSALAQFIECPDAPIVPPEESRNIRAWKSGYLDCSPQTTSSQKEKIIGIFKGYFISTNETQPKIVTFWVEKKNKLSQALHYHSDSTQLIAQYDDHTVILRHGYKKGYSFYDLTTQKATEINIDKPFSQGEVYFNNLFKLKNKTYINGYDVQKGAFVGELKKNKVTNIIHFFKENDPSIKTPQQSYLGNSVVLDDKFYFSLSTPKSGNELWVSDGTPAGTKIVREINTGNIGASVHDLIVFNHKLYFVAQNCDEGDLRLWSYQPSKQSLKSLAFPFSAHSIISMKINYSHGNNLYFQFKAGDGTTFCTLDKQEKILKIDDYGTISAFVRYQKSTPYLQRFEENYDDATQKIQMIDTLGKVIFEQSFNNHEEVNTLFFEQFGTTTLVVSNVNTFKQVIDDATYKDAVQLNGYDFATQQVIPYDNKDNAFQPYLISFCNDTIYFIGNNCSSIDQYAYKVDVANKRIVRLDFE